LAALQIARPVVTHTHAHSAALQLEQPYPGYVRSFLDVPLDSAGAATIPAGVPTTDPAATWINYSKFNSRNIFVQTAISQKDFCSNKPEHGLSDAVAVRLN